MMRARAWWARKARALPPAAPQKRAQRTAVKRRLFKVKNVPGLLILMDDYYYYTNR